METWDSRRTGWLLVLLGLAAVAALYWASLAQRPYGKDQDQIRALMIQGERALEERDLAAAFALVSREYRDDYGMRYASLRALAGRQLRQAASVEITLPERLLRITVDPDGKRAVGQARVDVRARSRYDTTYEVTSNLTLHFAKEPVRYYLLFPGHEWRLVKMEGWQGLVTE